MSTIWELSNKKGIELSIVLTNQFELILVTKGIKLTPNATFNELIDFCIIKKPGKLSDFLKILSHYGEMIV